MTKRNHLRKVGRQVMNEESISFFFFLSIFFLSFLFSALSLFFFLSSISKNIVQSGDEHSREHKLQPETAQEKPLAPRVAMK